MVCIIGVPAHTRRLIESKERLTCGKKNMENKNSKKKEIHAGILDEIKIRAKYTRQATKACRTFFICSQEPPETQL